MTKSAGSKKPPFDAIKGKGSGSKNFGPPVKQIVNPRGMKKK